MTTWFDLLEQQGPGRSPNWSQTGSGTRFKPKLTLNQATYQLHASSDALTRAAFHSINKNSADIQKSLIVER